MLLSLLLLSGCSLFADDIPCSDGTANGMTAGFDDGLSGCAFDDNVPDLLILNYGDPYAASSFVSCYKEGYADGFSDGQADESGLPTGDCE